LAKGRRREKRRPKDWEKSPTFCIAGSAAFAPGSPASTDSRASAGLARAVQSVGHRAEALAAAADEREARRPAMFTPDTSRNLIAAAISLCMSAILFAYAIVPATPGLA